MNLRLYRDEDLSRMLEIYGHYAANSNYTFETQAPSLDSFRNRIGLNHITLVITEGQEPLGFAYASRHRMKQAYDTVCETTIYIDPAHCGRGLGKRLYSALLDVLPALGIYTALGGITLGNPASVRLHESLGYRRFCSYENIGFKAGNWHTVDWYRVDLIPFKAAPKSIRRLEEVLPAVEALLSTKA